MIRKVFRNVNLQCVLQERELVRRDCRKGLLTENENGHFLFQETVAERRRVARPKLYNGELVSLVRLEDGTYRVYLKGKKNDRNLFDAQFPFRVYVELSEVFRFVNGFSAAGSPEDAAQLPDNGMDAPQLAGSVNDAPQLSANGTDAPHLSEGATETACLPENATVADDRREEGKGTEK